ncbi:16S rRNA (guanine(966)-N(2))-methyltransferase RsmD [Aliamphritea spongicola]|uniref:16S rRNA (guanine(966)-N(2))-methyltransferase RsmD n=1 Tax=Aliamphritea spongicola TaxID=707589 RepID=UPI00196B6141|nr:16S rRNA (guanine(966)-N(2))-methyltransferase RsmD [Aliamphritea spongicola]MBN3562357.1 16S rRNA (guanine(966)-N(2))-methyltransferase RsmD [Aliamphritea spongicola]
MSRRAPGRRPATKKTSTPKSGNQQLRIIAGEWRGRKLSFPAIEGLRPTPDRVRETLFNWIAAHIPGAKCLDLFTGSGALGLEALSRGAGQTTMIDLSAAATGQLQSNLQTLKATNANVIQADVQHWLSQQSNDQQYDLVFMDPPFRKDLAVSCCEKLESQGMLASRAMIYVETESELSMLQVPENWHLHREKKAGQVTYRLYIREQAGA